MMSITFDDANIRTILISANKNELKSVLGLIFKEIIFVLIWKDMHAKLFYRDVGPQKYMRDFGNAFLSANIGSRNEIFSINMC